MYNVRTTLLNHFWDLFWPHRGVHKIKTEMTVIACHRHNTNHLTFRLMIIKSNIENIKITTSVFLINLMEIFDFLIYKVSISFYFLLLSLKRMTDKKHGGCVIVL